MLKNIVDIVKDEEEEKRRKDAEKRRREAEARLQPPVPLVTRQRQAYEAQPLPKETRVTPKAQRQLAGVTRLMGAGREALGKGQEAAALIDFRRRKQEAENVPAPHRTLEQQRLAWAKTPEEFAQPIGDLGLGALKAGAGKAFQAVDVPRRLAKEHVYEPLTAIPNLGDLLEKAGVPPKVAGVLGGFLQAPGAGVLTGFAAAFNALSDEEKAEVVSYAGDPVLVAFFPGKTVQAIRGAARVTPRVTEAAAAFAKTPAFRRGLTALREAAVRGEAGFAKLPSKAGKGVTIRGKGAKEVGERLGRQEMVPARSELIGGTDIVGAGVERQIASEYQATILRATRRVAPEAVPEYVGGADIVGASIERGVNRAYGRDVDRLLRPSARGPLRPEYVGGEDLAGAEMDRIFAYRDLVDNELGMLSGETFEEALVRNHYAAMSRQGLETERAMNEWNVAARRAGFKGSTVEEAGPEMLRALAHRTEGGREAFVATYPEMGSLFDDVARVLDATEEVKVLHYGARGEQFPLIPNYVPGLYSEVPGWVTKTGKVGGKALPGRRQFFQKHRYLYRTTDEALDGFSLAERSDVERLLRLELEAERNVPYWQVPKNKAEIAARDQRIEMLEKVLADKYFPGTRYVSDDPMVVAQLAAQATEEMIQADLAMDRLRTASLLVPGSHPPTGYRIPFGIPAFQPKPMVAGAGPLGAKKWAGIRAAIKDEVDNLHAIAPQSAEEARRVTRQVRDLERMLKNRRLPSNRTFFNSGWAVPDNVATRLENYFETKVKFQTAASLLAKIATLPKRIKLIGTLFQHMDITLRGLMATVSSGGWRSSPRLVGESFASIFLPKMRAKLTREWLENPKLRAVLEAAGAPKGGQSIGTRSLTRLSEDWTRRFPVLGDIPVPTETGKAIQRQLNNIYTFASEGLFDGVYMANAKHVVLRWWDAYASNPRFANWTEKQIASAVGKDMHVLISTIPDWMSIANNPAARNFLRALFFSAAENEGLLRGTVRIGTGLNPGIWRKYWLSYYTSVFLIGQSINRAVTGHWFTPEQLTPWRVDWSGRPRMNWQFLRPIYSYSSDGRPLYLDLLMQQDTAPRWVQNPLQAGIDRSSVPLQIIYRTIQNRQFSGVPVTTAPKEWQKWLDRALYTAKQAGLPLSAEALTEEAREYGWLGGVMATMGVNIVPGPYTTPKLRDFLKEHDVDPDEGVWGLKDVPDSERVAFLRSHGDTEKAWLKALEESKQRGSEFAKMTIKSHELRSLDYAQQIAVDMEYWGESPLAKAEWRRVRSDHGATISGAWEQWERDFAELLDDLPADDVEGNVMQEYSLLVYGVATDPETNILDKDQAFENRDRWLATSGQDVVEIHGKKVTKAQIVEDHLGVSMTSREREYILDAIPKMIPAWEFEDGLWQELQGRPALQKQVGVDQFEIERFDSPRELREWLVATKTTNKLVQKDEEGDPAYSPPAAGEEAVEETDRAMSRLYEWNSLAMSEFYVTPEGRIALRTQTAWGYKPNVREDLEYLLE